MKLEGAFTAIVTPFDVNNNIDLGVLKELIEFQISAGITGIVPNGTTGESPSLTEDEFELLISKSIEYVDGRCLVIAGTGSNNTVKSIELSKRAIALGVDLVMLITPYYNKPGQKGIYGHLAAVAGAIAPFPMIIYNVPSRTAVNIIPNTVKELQDKFSNIIGIKDASCDFEQILEFKRCLPEDFAILSGDDGQLLPYLACGANGVVSVMSNVVPEETIKLCQLYKEGKTKEALKLQNKLSPLVNALFIETNPIPVKFALNSIGIKVGVPRLPLHEFSKEHRENMLSCLRIFN